MIFFHGYKDDQQNGLYMKQVQKLLDTVKRRMEYDLSEYKKKSQNIQKDSISKEIYSLPLNQGTPVELGIRFLFLIIYLLVFASGVIVNTPVYSSFDSYKSIISTLDIGIIYVLDNDRQYQRMLSEFPDKRDSIFNLSKSRGVVQIDSQFQKHIFERKFFKYLHGEKNELRSTKYVIPFEDVKIVKITSMDFFIYNNFIYFFFFTQL
jgi:hypothetical protein